MFAFKLCDGITVTALWKISLSSMRFKGRNQSLYKSVPRAILSFLFLCGVGLRVEASDNVCGWTPGKISIKYTWQKSLVSREQFQIDLCTRTCSNGNIRNYDLSSCPEIRCFDCMCERPKCESYGTCCPNDPRHPSLETTTAVASRVQHDGSQTPGRMDTPVLKCEASGTSSGYLYIQSCPRAYNDSQTRRLCEEEYKPEEKPDLTLDQFARVSDSVLEAVYYNKYCALCNGALQPVQWEVKVDCDHFLAVYTATTFDQLLTLSLQPESSCKVKQLPLVKHLTPCNRTWFR
ncbi:hypothetical protein PoB_002948300 [Plakobranchus ocellatus]|uniref:SMB domain-containing protein n=1 Tax=Plakobranchus ocellatus TaxID=259542 RepID=A0AAV4A702_9GAST|nr:hypothetical protein PoB_002948300 [Plakobranchus ocellatus]